MLCSGWGQDASPIRRALLFACLLALAAIACYGALQVQHAPPTLVQRPGVAGDASAVLSACAAMLQGKPAAVARQQPEATAGHQLWQMPPPRREHCAPLDGLLENRTTQWAITTDGSSVASATDESLPQWRLLLADCPLARFTGEGARRCLQNKTVIFIGDSVVR